MNSIRHSPIDEKIKLFRNYLYLKGEFSDLPSKLHFCEIYYNGLENFVDAISKSELNNLVKRNGQKLFSEREIELITKAKQFILEPNSKKIGYYRCKIISTVTLSREVEVEFKVINRDCVDSQDEYQKIIKEEALETYDKLFPEDDYSQFEFEDADTNVVKIEYLGC